MRALLAPVVAAVLAAGTAVGSPPAPGEDLDALVRRLDPQVRVLDPQVRSLRTEVDDGATTAVTLSSDVLFDFDSAALTPRAQQVVADTGRQLADRPGALAVVGHTDGVGTPAYNQDLSERRAAAVAAALRPAAGDRPVASSGVGETQPAAPESVGGRDDPAGRALNRRVVVTLTG